MRLFKSASLLCLLSTSLLTQQVFADNNSEKTGFALGVGAGSTGISLNATYQLSSQFNLRGIYAQYDFTTQETESGINYDFTIDLDTFSLLLDWHPFANSGFRVSLGGVNNDTNFSARSTQTTGNITVGNSTFNAADVGTLNATVDYDSFAPYFGIGWGNAVGKQKNLSFALDVGVIGMDNPNVNVTSSGTNATIQTALDTAIEEEKAELEADLDQFDLFPVLNLSLNYQF